MTGLEFYSQAALKALTNPEGTSILECRKALKVLTNRNTLPVYWVPKHSGNEKVLSVHWS